MVARNRHRPRRPAIDIQQLLHGFRQSDITAEHVFSGGGLCVTSAIKSLMPGTRFAGRAFTVKTQPGFTRQTLAALDQAQRDDVLVIEAHGDMELAAWGGVAHWHADRKGIAAVVIDGVTRDLVEIRQTGCPLFARGQSPPIVTFGPRSAGALQIPIVFGGVLVRPGDIVMGDDDGVVVVPIEKAEECLTLARKSVQFDLKEMRWVEAGKSIHDLIEMLWESDGTNYRANKWRWVDEGPNV